MTDNNTQFENYLREFAPRRPRALPLAQAARSHWFSRLAAAAILLIVFSLSLYLSIRQPSSPQNTAVASQHPRPSFAVLTRQAVENPESLDTLLDAFPENRLPSFDQENTVLHALARP